LNWLRILNQGRENSVKMSKSMQRLKTQFTYFYSLLLGTFLDDFQTRLFYWKFDTYVGMTILSLIIPKQFNTPFN